MEKNSRTIKRVLLSGGGTGGHIYPAVAIANELNRQFPDIEVLFVGSKARMEMEKVPKAGYPIEGLWISGFDRKNWKKNLLFPIKLIHALWKSHKIIKNFKPDVCIGTGGFASGPVNWMATQKNIPLLIQEQNSFPGITNKLLAQRASKVCIANEEVKKYFPKDNIVVTGNPVRNDLISVHSKEQARKVLQLKEMPTLLIIGGSLGAKTINQTIEKGLNTFDEEKIQLIWQTGKNFTTNKQFKYGLRKVFIYDMANAYAAADVVISRAGALSISELAATHKPCILVPSPNVAEDHQTKNALVLAQKNAAIMVSDQEAKSKLIAVAAQLLKNTERQNALSEAIKQFNFPNATAEIVNAIKEIYASKS